MRDNDRCVGTRRRGRLLGTGNRAHFREVSAPELRAGIDAGKAHHHCVVIDTDGKRLLSRRVANDETDLLELIADAITLAASGTVTWAVDLNGGGAALMLALLTNGGQQLLYIPGPHRYPRCGQLRR
jgi:hypothetical protein